MGDKTNGMETVTGMFYWKEYMLLGKKIELYWGEEIPILCTHRWAQQARVEGSKPTDTHS